MSATNHVSDGHRTENDDHSNNVRHERKQGS